MYLEEKGISRTKLRMIRLESRVRVWGAVFLALLFWVFIGVIVFNVDGPGYMMFTFATVLHFFLRFTHMESVNTERITAEDTLIGSEAEAEAAGASVFWRALHTVSRREGFLDENIVAIVRHDSDKQAWALKGEYHGVYGVMVTDWILEALDEKELEAVVSHEMAHITDVGSDLNALCVIDAIINASKSLSGAIPLASIILVGVWMLGYGDQPGDLMLLTLVNVCTFIFGFGWGHRLIAFIWREHEYMADAIGCGKMGLVWPMINALTKIVEPRPANTIANVIHYEPKKHTHPCLEDRMNHLLRIRK